MNGFQSSMSPRQLSLVVFDGRCPATLLQFRRVYGRTTERVLEVQKNDSQSGLPGDAVYDFEWGTDISVENLQKGFTHCFVFTFLSEAGRSEYLPHPAHEEFGKLLKPHLGDVLVIDYWAN